MKPILVAILMTITLSVAAQNIELYPKAVNFGAIPIKPKSEKTFAIHNRSAQPVVIKAINVDCNCIKMEWKKTPIKSGDSTIVKVIYTPADTGVFYKKAYVLTSGGNSDIIIRGNVK